jgi:hypothetical protein
MASEMSLIDIAASLEKAAFCMRSLDRPPSSEALEHKVSNIKEDMTQQADAVLKALVGVTPVVQELGNKLLTAQQASDARRSAEATRLLAATKAASHAQMARAIHDKDIGRRSTLLEQRILVRTAALYGWKPDAKRPHENEDGHTERNWRSALECLLIVTVPSLIYGEASYDNFVK